MAFLLAAIATAVAFLNGAILLPMTAWSAITAVAGRRYLATGRSITLPLIMAAPLPSYLFSLAALTTPGLLNTEWSTGMDFLFARIASSLFEFLPATLTTAPADRYAVAVVFIAALIQATVFAALLLIPLAHFHAKLRPLQETQLSYISRVRFKPAVFTITAAVMIGSAVSFAQAALAPIDTTSWPPLEQWFAVPKPLPVVVAVVASAPSLTTILVAISFEPLIQVFYTEPNSTPTN